MRERDWDNEDDERIHEKSKLITRENPCRSCPYRRDVPSGVWAAEEYDRLPGYDGDTGYQSVELFACHQADGHLCSGWAAHREPIDLLALRIGVGLGVVDPDVFDHRTDVPLFASGADAAVHGKRDIERPGDDARAMIEHLLMVRARRGTREEDVG